MSAPWSADTRFKKTEIVRFPTDSKTKTPEAQYWKHLQFPVTIQEFGPISKIDVCRTNPHYIAVTASTKVQIFNPSTNQVYKTLTKFRDAAYGGKFRRDGKLICVGGDDGAIKIFDTASKTLLRVFQAGDENRKSSALVKGIKAASGVATRCCEFTVDSRHVAGFSDDKSVRLWDVATEEIVASWTDQHQDYVRTGCTSETSSDVLVSGSYDHMVKLWDARRKQTAISTFDHGSPVESVMMFPNGSLLVTAGGPEIRIWDLLAGRLLTKLSPHNKTVTCLAVAKGGTRIVSGSLDRQIKFHDISTFQTVHSLSFPSPILTMAVASDDSVVCAGMSDGLVQFLHRKIPPSVAEIEKEMLAKKKATPHYRYLQYTHFEPQKEDVVVKQDKGLKELRHDYFLRKFEYSKALDQVLKPYVQKKFPEYTFSVLRELKRRNGLKTALGGRDDKSLKLVLQYLAKYVADPRFSQQLLGVVDTMLDLYEDKIGTSPEMDKIFVDISRRVDREARNQKQLMSLQGMIDLILAASYTTERPNLRNEEIALQNHLKLYNLKLSEPSTNAFSWEKTLVHEI